MTVTLGKLEATTAGSRSAPLQRWFPFPEGFSPSFVDRVLEEYHPGAHRVLDPFAGSGTTPLAVASRGREAFYCEVNPAYQALISAKASALSMSTKERERVSQALAEISATPGWLADFKPDEQLIDAYSRVFGVSRFFLPIDLTTVARARTAVDTYLGTDELLSRFLQVAVLAALVPSSLLVRRGDLRFRTDAELERRRQFASEVARIVSFISTDLLQLEGVAGPPRLVANDARQLEKLPGLDLDAIVTSPPYLNGTNYARNTKLELWFLRVLRRGENLRGVRNLSIAAGINDVRSDAAPGYLPPSIVQVVQQLASQAYDGRIPRLVEQYFVDMGDAFRAFHRHLLPEARVIVDIGDSSYGGVRVATDDLLVDLLVELGYRLVDRVVIRRRRSRDGTALRQTLLVLGVNASPLRPPPSSWPLPAQWDAFKTQLPHRAPPLSKRNWGNPLHSLCSYGGKMKPSIAASLVAAFVPKGGRVLDPFAGVGTIPFEAVLQGAEADAFEISPSAWHVARAKLESPDAIDCRRVLQDLSDFIRAPENEPLPANLAAAGAFGFNGRLEDYYHPVTFREVLRARAYFQLPSSSTPAHSFVMACLLHVLHGNRPYALSRRSHPITPFAPTGPTEYRSLLSRLSAKVDRSLASTQAPPNVGHAYFTDATQPWPAEVKNLDAVITSPPFFDSTRFYLANWIRLWFAGWDPADFGRLSARFVDMRQKRTFDVYEPIFRQARERLKAGGVLVLHLGISRKSDMVHELATVARPWFRVADVFWEDVRSIEHHGIRDKGTVSDHGYLILS